MGGSGSGGPNGWASSWPNASLLEDILPPWPDRHERRRASWYRNYLEAQTQRDVPDLARIRSLEALPRLLALAAVQTAQLFNASKLAAPFQLTRPTIESYVTLLESVFLLEKASGPGTAIACVASSRRPSSISATRALPARFWVRTRPCSPPTGRCWVGFSKLSFSRN